MLKSKVTLEEKYLLYSFISAFHDTTYLSLSL